MGAKANRQDLEGMDNASGRSLILAAVVAACAAGGLSGYSKTGVNDQQKNTDYYECQRDSSVLVWRSKMHESVPDTEKLNACMRARGYTVL